MKLSSYFLLSFLLAVGNLVHAYTAYEQFYPATVHLSSDKVSRVILYNFAFSLFLAFALGVLRLFVGTLRDLEVEQLIDTGRGFLADTILFLIFYSPTIDGKEVDTVYLGQFICRIIFMKAFHLIVQIRVGHMFEVGLPRHWVNIKLSTLMVILLIHDITSLRIYFSLATRESTFYHWIVFESQIMFVMLIATFCKYFVHLIDMRLDNGWPGKSVYLFYVDLIGDVANMILFLIFMMTFFFQNPTRLPVYMLADVIQVARQLAMKLKAFGRFTAITANMDQKFPNATPEELEKADSCIICRDILTEGSKKLPCSHVFHLDCLKSWVVMQQCCPTCRADIPADPIPQANAAAAAADARVGAAPVEPAAQPGAGAAHVPRPGQPAVPRPPAAGPGAAPYQIPPPPPGQGLPGQPPPNNRPPPSFFDEYNPPPMVTTTTDKVTGEMRIGTEGFPPTTTPLSQILNHMQMPGSYGYGVPMMNTEQPIQEVFTAIKHCHEMAVYMRKQQEFWMRQAMRISEELEGPRSQISHSHMPPMPIFPESLEKLIPAPGADIRMNETTPAASSSQPAPKSVKIEEKANVEVPLIRSASEIDDKSNPPSPTGALLNRTISNASATSGLEDLRELQRNKWEAKKKDSTVEE